VLVACGGAASRPPDGTLPSNSAVAPEPTPVSTPTVEELLSSLRDPASAATRASAAAGLADVRDPSIVPALLSALADDDLAVRIAVATSLGSQGDASAAKPLAAALQAELKADPASAFIGAAAVALGQLGGTTGVAALIAVLATTDETNLEAARSALKEIGAPAVPALQKALTTGEQAKKLQVVGVLASLGDAGVKPLITALTISDAKVRSAAANRLGYLGDRSAEKALATALADSAMGLTASIALTRLYKDEPSQLVHYLSSTRTLHAYYGLLKVGAPETVSALASALRKLGDLDMAEDFLNCGEPTLEKAARDWAAAHGYEVVTNYGTADETWGGGLPE
jgi:HEAT repeat protein